MTPPRRNREGFTLVEVLIALSLSALLFAAALNLLLGVLTAWERAREGDLEADADYRMFAFLRSALEGSGMGGDENVEVARLPGGQSDYYLNFVLRGSPLAERWIREWKTERFALVPDGGSVRLVPFVEGDDLDKPDEDEGLFLYGEGVEVAYWVWDDVRERWEEEEELESERGREPEVPGYLILRFGDEERIRWIRINAGEGGRALW